MEAKIIQDKRQIENFCMRNPDLYLYHIGDLDDFFWPHITWFGLVENNDLTELAFLYQDEKMPILCALSDNLYRSLKLLETINDQLPAAFYSHLVPGADKELGNLWGMEPHGRYLRMMLDNSVKQYAAEKTEILTNNDLLEVQEFYQNSYPGNWFAKRMIETGMYLGYRINGELVAVAGVHVYSEEFGVASLGNITVRPDCRGKGIASRITSALCKRLQERVQIIGLNVKSDNHAAISCYEKVGFSIKAEYDEFMIRRLRG